MLGNGLSNPQSGTRAYNMIQHRLINFMEEDKGLNRNKRPGRKVAAARRQVARTYLIEAWQNGQAEELPPKVRLAVETLVPGLGRHRDDTAKM